MGALRGYIATTFSEYGHNAYQGNEVYISMLVNRSPLHTPLTPWIRSKCHFFFFERSLVACETRQIRRIYIPRRRVI